jgi:23S rRNA (cytosine1962-C5)-methyltransferase
MMRCPMDTIILKKGRESSLLRRHPWIFTGAISKVTGTPGLGDTVQIKSFDGRILATGAYSPVSQIRVRAWSFLPDEPIQPDFFKGRLKQAFELRKALGFHSADAAYRLVNAESDGLPGLIVDRYSDFLVCQFLSAGAEKWKPVITELLMEMASPKGIFDRSSADAMSLEGLSPHTGPLAGALPPDLVEIREGAARFFVDIVNGHKTGFYLDQRENRLLAGSVSNGKSVLNCFSYTGGFAIHALQGGAKVVTSLDSSDEAMGICRKNHELNAFSSDRWEFSITDVFKTLRRFRDEDRRFDIIILDPPKFASSAASVAKAARGYKDINLLAFKLLNPGGFLLTFSCSGHISPPLFQKIVADAALDAGRSARILRFLHQSPDHPTDLAFPEGLYLKGFMVRTL